MLTLLRAEFLKWNLPVEDLDNSIVVVITYFGEESTSGLKLRVQTKKIIFLFLIQNICCGYSKEPSQ